MTVTHPIHIEVESHELLDERIDAAVRQLQQKSIDMAGSGILLVRHAAGRYTAALSPEVPFGVTYEVQL
jgi:hypothetical protein